MKIQRVKRDGSAGAVTTTKKAGEIGKAIETFIRGSSMEHCQYVAREPFYRSYEIKVSWKDRVGGLVNVRIGDTSSRNYKIVEG